MCSPGHLVLKQEVGTVPTDLLSPAHVRHLTLHQDNRATPRVLKNEGTSILRPGGKCPNVTELIRRPCWVDKELPDIPPERAVGAELTVGLRHQGQGDRLGGMICGILLLWLCDYIPSLLFSRLVHSGPRFCVGNHLTLLFYGGLGAMPRQSHAKTSQEANLGLNPSGFRKSLPAIVSSQVPGKSFHSSLAALGFFFSRASMSATVSVPS